MTDQHTAINIIGAGLSGLSAARRLSEAGRCVRLISVQPSERAQSNLAEGGINAALNVMGEDDSPLEHFRDTMAGGVNLADPEMVRGLTEAAPEIVYDMEKLGVPFHHENGHIIERNFGGQKKKRTAYAMSSTGKVLTAALIDCVRRFECKGLVERFPHHRFERLLTETHEDGSAVCTGVQVRDINTQTSLCFSGPVLMACGGLNGFFTGTTTGTTANTGTAAAQLFTQGVRMANLEFLQYHPTTVEITGKRMLISEAARGEGGRLFFEKDGEKHYFMEEKYGERGNLMPRDVISREMALLNAQAFLDLTGLPKETWQNRLSDLREEIIHYMAVDPAKEPVPVSPGIHYFMGGIFVNGKHQTNLPGLYASGECACAYHGANRLGGNSLLGAIYGGRTAADFMLEDNCCQDAGSYESGSYDSGSQNTFGQSTGRKERLSGPGSSDIGRSASGSDSSVCAPDPYTFMAEAEKPIEAEMETILKNVLGVLRDEQSLEKAMEELKELRQTISHKNNSFSRENNSTGPENESAAASFGELSDELSARLDLAEAMIRSALERKESRGAHTRLDYPETQEDFRKTTIAECKEGMIRISFAEI